MIERQGTTLAASVATAIEHEVIAQGWPVGRTIGSEPELLRRYAVSRPVLRQATGIVESHQVARMRRGPGGGLVVTEPTEAAVATSVALYLEHLNVPREQVVGGRESIEVTCVQLATQRLDDGGAARLSAIVADEKERFAAGEEYSLYDLHSAIGELSGNAVLELFVKTLMTLSRHRHGGGIRATDEVAAVGRLHVEHLSIVDAMVARDVSLARHRMLRHLRG